MEIILIIMIAVCVLLIIAYGNAFNKKDVAEKSHVLTAMNVPEEFLKGSIRFSFGKNVSKEDIDYTIQKLVEIVGKLRSISSVTKTGRAK